MPKGAGSAEKINTACATREAPKRLVRLRTWIVKHLKPIDKFVRQVCPHGFLFRHAQHACCELRKWERRKGRRPCALRASARSKVRRARLLKLWRPLVSSSSCC